MEREERASTENRTIEIHIVHCDGLVLAGFSPVSRRSERVINGLLLSPHRDARDERFQWRRRSMFQFQQPCRLAEFAVELRVPGNS